VERLTLARQAYAEIQRRILSGELAAGQRLLPDALANALAISQTPVKEALALLERDGLVTGVDRRASLVRRFTPTDILEIYEARILLELNALATGFHAGRLDADFIAAVERNLAAQAVQYGVGTRESLAEIIALDRSLHAMILEAGGNKVLAGWHHGIQLQLQTAQTYSIANYDIGRSRDEHQRILAALRTGRLEPMQAALRDHLEASRDDLIRRHPDDLPLRRQLA